MMCKHSLPKSVSRMLIQSFFLSLLTISSLLATGKPEELVDLEALKKEFVATFAQTYTKLLLGDGSAPLIMEPSIEVRAQRNFTRVLERNPQLKGYAVNLNEFLRDLHLSHKHKDESILRLMIAELRREIPAHQGFATDYILPSFPFRQHALQAMSKMIMLKIQQDKLARNVVQNARYDHTTIEHINMQFERSIKQFQFMLEGFEEEILARKAGPSRDEVDPSWSAEDLDYINQMLPQIDQQASFFNRHYALMGIECDEQSCRLFLPLVKAMMEDKNTKRTLKQQDKKVFDSLQGSLALYESLRLKLAGHLHKFETDRQLLTEPKVQVEEVKDLPSPPQPQPAKKKEKAVSSSAPQPVAKVLRRARTDTPAKVEAPAPSLPAAVSSSPVEDQLTPWLLSQSQSTNLKSQFLQPSEQELRRERKQQAKEEKRQKSAEVDEKSLEKKGPDATEPEEEVKPMPIFHITGSYDLFEEIMNETYTGEMEAVQLLIKTRFKGMAYLSHGRWHFALPHISQNHATVFASTLEPATSEEKEELTSSSTETIAKKATSTAITVHNPHKFGSKRLRPYHVRDIKELFEQGGYTLETVKEVRK